MKIFVLKTEDSKKQVPQSAMRTVFAVLSLARKELKLPPVTVKWFSKQRVEDPEFVLDVSENVLGLHRGRDHEILLWLGLVYEEDELAHTAADEAFHVFQSQSGISNYSEDLCDEFADHIVKDLGRMTPAELEDVFLQECLMKDFSQYPRNTASLSLPKPAEVSLTKHKARITPRRIEKIGRIIN